MLVCSSKLNTYIMSRKSDYPSAVKTYLALCALISFCVCSSASYGDASDNLPPYQLGKGQTVITIGVPIYGLVMMIPSLTPKQREELQTVYDPFNKESIALREQILILMHRNPKDIRQIRELEMKRVDVTRRAWQAAKPMLHPEQFKELRQLALKFRPLDPYVQWRP